VRGSPLRDGREGALLAAAQRFEDGARLLRRASVGLEREVAEPLERVAGLLSSAARELRSLLDRLREVDRR